MTKLLPGLLFYINHKQFLNCFIVHSYKHQENDWTLKKSSRACLVQLQLQILAGTCFSDLKAELINTFLLLVINEKRVREDYQLLFISISQDCFVFLFMLTAVMKIIFSCFQWKTSEPTLNYLLHRKQTQVQSFLWTVNRDVAHTSFMVNHGKIPDCYTVVELWAVLWKTPLLKV